MKKYLIFFVTSFFLLISKCIALTEAPVDVTKMSLIEIEEAMDKGYITSEQLVNIYLERIEEYNDKFNAYYLNISICEKECTPSKINLTSFSIIFRLFFFGI